MTKENVRIYFQQENFYEEIGLQINAIGEKGEKLVATDIIFTERLPGSAYGATALLDASARVTNNIGISVNNAAQEIMDSLWRLGIRPNEAKTGNELIQSLNDHLADMRKISFESLKIKDWVKP